MDGTQLMFEGRAAARGIYGYEDSRRRGLIPDKCHVSITQ